ncbi:hypothetical protein [Kitasatospora sp. GP82]|uniref:hypothetical protein n=1 Tax=Kitasatospora sp. GP82 TaxID=3035089 RepID=UPI0024732093|nr:hypothetical protein [Kitasatospora sp. GP82]MDH6130342.1 hypothetical protein [Kitasatospora sp. GP82]
MPGRTTPAVAAAAACILLATGCSSNASTRIQARPAPSASSPTASVSATASANPLQPPAQSPHPTQDELTAALPTAPPDSRPWAGSTGPVGLLTPDQYLGMMPAATQQVARPKETRRGLQFVARRNWAQPDGALVDVRLVRYATPVGAQSYFLAERTIQRATNAANAFTIPGIADSGGLANPTLDKAGNANVMVQILAGDTVIIIFEASPATPDRDGATAIAKQVYPSLCTVQSCSPSTAGTGAV